MLSPHYLLQSPIAACCMPFAIRLCPSIFVVLVLAIKPINTNAGVQVASQYRAIAIKQNDLSNILMTCKLIKVHYPNLYILGRVVYTKPDTAHVPS